MLDVFGRKLGWRPGTQSEPRVRWTRLPGASTTSSFGGAAWLIGIVVIAVGALLLLPYMSEPVLRLKAAPPAGFVSIHAQGNINEAEWARGYWRCARELQSRYTYAAALPDEPPPQFHIAEEGTLAPEKAERIRRLYWAGVQKAWLNPDAWESVRTRTPRWLEKW
jgi:hypothetical protein